MYNCKIKELEIAKPLEPYQEYVDNLITIGFNLFTNMCIRIV